MKIVRKTNNKINTFLFRMATKIQQLTFWDIFKITMIITTILVIASVLSFAVHAANVDGGIGAIDKFDQLSGDTQKWLSSTYRNNYYLDIDNSSLTYWDFFEKGANGIANILFSLLCILSYVCIAVFYFCFDTNIADLFKDIINTMQSSLKTGIFDNLFLVAFVFVSAYLIKQILKRNTAEIMSQILKVVSIIILAFMLTTDTSVVITNATEIAKTIGAKAVVSINNQESTSSYAADVSGALWYSLVHEPWEMMEASNKLSKSDEEAILKEIPESTSRQQRIKELHQHDSNIFDKEAGLSRIPQAFIILVISILKAGVMLLIGLIQIAFQVMAILCVLLSMIALLLALVPQLGGLTLIENLAKRIFETQIGIVVTTFVLALITKMDGLIMVDFAKATGCGWLICLIIQAAIYVFIYVFRAKIFKMFNVASRNIKAKHIVPRNMIGDKAHNIAERSSGGAIRASKNISKVPGGAIRKVKSIGDKFGGKKRNNKNSNEYTNTNANSEKGIRNNNINEKEPNKLNNGKVNNDKKSKDLRNNVKSNNDNANRNLKLRNNASNDKSNGKVVYAKDYQNKNSNRNNAVRKMNLSDSKRNNYQPSNSKMNIPQSNRESNSNKLRMITPSDRVKARLRTNAGSSDYNTGMRTSASGGAINAQQNNVGNGARRLKFNQPIEQSRGGVRINNKPQSNRSDNVNKLKMITPADRVRARMRTTSSSGDYNTRTRTSTSSGAVNVRSNTIKSNSSNNINNQTKSESNRRNINNTKSNNRVEGKVNNEKQSLRLSNSIRKRA
ncbi:hypothetical protein [Clostridium saccharoperbutylacetonicum]|uniref:hypothetical protein n=1 Tax=Clostridium saccharoperbutylacetonicum TaxID=36745 RepID=UPI0039EA983D